MDPPPDRLSQNRSDDAARPVNFPTGKNERRPGPPRFLNREVAQAAKPPPLGLEAPPQDIIPTLEAEALAAPGPERY